MQHSKPLILLSGFLTGVIFTILAAVPIVKNGYLTANVGDVTIHSSSSLGQSLHSTSSPSPYRCSVDENLACPTETTVDQHNNCLYYQCVGGFCELITFCTRYETCDGAGTCVDEDSSFDDCSTTSDCPSTVSDFERNEMCLRDECLNGQCVVVDCPVDQICDGAGSCGGRSSSSSPYRCSVDENLACPTETTVDQHNNCLYYQCVGGFCELITFCGRYESCDGAGTCVQESSSSSPEG